MLSDYNKFIGAIIGALLGAVALYFKLPPEVISPEVTAFITTAVLGALGTFFAPKNTN
jgi:uncharacterized membrane protein YccC